MGRNFKERELCINQRVYIPVYGFIGGRNFWVKEGYVVELYGRKSTVFGVKVGKEVLDYKLSQFKKSIFATEDAAIEFIERLPKKGAYVYTIVNGVVIVREVKGYINHRNDNQVDICIVLTTGNEISITEIDKSLFLTYTDAVDHL